MDERFPDRRVEYVDEHVHVQIDRRRRVLKQRIADVDRDVTGSDVSEPFRAEVREEPLDCSPVDGRGASAPVEFVGEFGPRVRESVDVVLGERNERLMEWLRSRAGIVPTEPLYLRDTWKPAECCGGCAEPLGGIRGGVSSSRLP